MCKNFKQTLVFNMVALVDYVHVKLATFGNAV